MIKTPGLLRQPAPPPFVWTFGKWAGTPVNELPRSYLNWVTANCVDEDGCLTIDAEAFAAAEAELAKRTGGGTPDARPQRPRTANGHNHCNGHAPTHRRPTADNEYAAFEQEQLKAGAWAALPRSWARCFGLRAAGVLTHLLNRGKVAADPDGWFAVDRLLDELGLDDAQAAKVLDRLEDRGVIELNGRRSTRVRVLLDDLKAALEENP